MDTSQKVTLSVAVVLGLGVLASYVPVVRDYRNHDYWVGFSKDTVRVYYALQVLAAAGFLTFLFSYCLGESAQEGLLKHPAVAPTLTAVLLLAAIGWGLAIYAYFQRPSAALKAVVSLCLVVTAVCSILLLAGYVESDSSNWYATLGLLLFCVVTVLADGVAWNARFIRTVLD